MSDMKCPFCQQELEIRHTNMIRRYACPDLTCKGYYMSATKDMWQELIRTRKALDIAKDALTTIGGYSYYNDCVGVALDATDDIYNVLEQQGE